MTEEETPPDHPVGPTIRRLRQDAGLSLADLAKEINYSRGYISKVETGVAPANEMFARRCDQFFGTGGMLAGLVRTRAAMAVTRQIRAMTCPVELPSAPTHFTGRTQETIAIQTHGHSDNHLGIAPVTVVHGMPGVGKTALVIHAGHRMRAQYPDGCLYLELSTRDPSGSVPAAEALDRLLRRLGVPGEAIPHHAGDRSAMYRSLLHDRRMLIVLDDARDADQVGMLTPATSGCRVLVTSRHHLPALDAAQSIHLKPLDPSAASALFHDVCGNEQLASDEVITGIVRACSGLPLAIRTAAARCRISPWLSQHDVSQRLADPVKLLSIFDDGERSVRRTLASACAELPPRLRTLLTLLALHPGPAITLDAAAWLSACPIDNIIDDLDNLALANLLDVRANGTYALHNLVRMVADVLYVSDIDRNTSIARLIDSYVAAAEASDEKLTPHRYRPAPRTVPSPVSFVSRGQAYHWCAKELDNIIAVSRLAWTAGLDQQCWRLAYAMRGYFFITKEYEQWIAIHRIGLAASQRSGHIWAEAVTHNNLGLALVGRGHPDSAGTHYRAALRLFTRLADKRGQSATLGHQAWLHYLYGLPETARQLASRALALYEEHPDPRGSAITTRTLSLIEAACGRHREAVRLLETALSAFAILDLPIDIAMTLNCLGEVFTQMGDDRSAREVFQQAVQISREVGSAYELTRALEGLGHQAHDRIKRI